VLCRVFSDMQCKSQLSTISCWIVKCVSAFGLSNNNKWRWWILIVAVLRQSQSSSADLVWELAAIRHFVCVKWTGFTLAWKHKNIVIVVIISHITAIVTVMVRSSCLSVGLLITTMSPAKMADAIKMLFGVVSQVGPRNDVLGGGQIFTSWMLFMSPNRKCQSREGYSEHWLQWRKITHWLHHFNYYWIYEEMIFPNPVLCWLQACIYFHCMLFDCFSFLMQHKNVDVPLNVQLVTNELLVWNSSHPLSPGYVLCIFVTVSCTSNACSSSCLIDQESYWHQPSGDLNLMVCFDSCVTTWYHLIWFLGFYPSWTGYIDTRLCVVTFGTLVSVSQLLQSGILSFLSTNVY